jgi:hypothetical protein
VKHSQPKTEAEIDESVKETFPASDPPSWTMGIEQRRNECEPEGGRMISTTTTRVEEHTAQYVNEHIQRKMEMNLKAYGSSPETIDSRLKDLDEEWDMERLLEANGSTLLLVGLGLSVLVSRRWLILPFAVGGFCLQHALQGWCPPIELFRRLGIRTAKEIQEERTALKVMRGDFESADSKAVEHVIEVVRR